jgi:hypothetical protein
MVAGVKGGRGKLGEGGHLLRASHRALALSFALCSERERRAAISRLGVRSGEREWSGVGSEGLGWGVL